MYLFIHCYCIAWKCASCQSTHFCTHPFLPILGADRCHSLRGNQWFYNISNTLLSLQFFWVFFSTALLFPIPLHFVSLYPHIFQPHHPHRINQKLTSKYFTLIFLSSFISLFSQFHIIFSRCKILTVLISCNNNMHILHFQHKKMPLLPWEGVQCANNHVHCQSPVSPDSWVLSGRAYHSLASFVNPYIEFHFSIYNFSLLNDIMPLLTWSLQVQSNLRDIID